MWISFPLIRRPSSSACAIPSGRKGFPGVPSASRPKKLSYNEQRELAQLPGRIEALEGEAYVACGSITLAGAVAGILA